MLCPVNLRINDCSLKNKTQLNLFRAKDENFYFSSLPLSDLVTGSSGLHPKGQMSPLFLDNYSRPPMHVPGPIGYTL